MVNLQRPPEQVSTSSCELRNERLPEAQYLDEFCRCSHLHSRGSLVLFPTQGWLLPLVKKRSGEVLQDGWGLEHHSNPLLRGETYARYTEHSNILDFSISERIKPHPAQSACSLFSGFYLLHPFQTSRIHITSYLTRRTLIIYMS